MARQTGSRISSRAVKQLTTEQLHQFGQFEDVTLAMASDVAVIHTLNAQFDKLEAPCSSA